MNILHIIPVVIVKKFHIVLLHEGWVADHVPSVWHVREPVSVILVPTEHDSVHDVVKPSVIISTEPLVTELNSGQLT